MNRYSLARGTRLVHIATVIVMPSGVLRRFVLCAGMQSRLVDHHWSDETDAEWERRRDATMESLSPITEIIAEASIRRSPCPRCLTKAARTPKEDQ